MRTKIINFLKKFVIFCIVNIFIIAAGFIGLMMGYIFYGRMHGNVLLTECEFTESSRELANPYRGFHRMYGIIAKDEGDNYGVIVSGYGDDTELLLLQINLCRYTGGAISEAALVNIDKYFQELEDLGKQCIIRFIYDWDGKSLEVEPESIDVILNHMQQLEPIFKKYEDIIFIHQGIFVGNCGEMNGSKYLSTEDMTTLISKLAEVTAPSTFLAVRTPSQWRNITQIVEPNHIVSEDSLVASRLGLYNDGIMGTEQDYGTYGILTKEEAGPFLPWDRVAELAFQDELCKIVPNGGEVIVENHVNDFENAVESLSAMHVTYLNRYYDQNVMNKWAESTVTEDGCFNGMDGLTYIDRHLGYRLLIKHAELEYEFLQDKLLIDIGLQNVGFAPMYINTDLHLILYDEEHNISHTYQLDGDLRVLTGGRDKEEVLTISKEISLNGLDEGNYSLYFYITIPNSGRNILLANEQDNGEYGYFIGSICVEPEDALDDLFSQELKEQVSKILNRYFKKNQK